MQDDVRAVGVGRREVEGVVLNVVLLVERLPETGREEAAGRNTVQIVGREGRRFLSSVPVTQNSSPFVKKAT